MSHKLPGCDRLCQINRSHDVVYTDVRITLFFGVFLHFFLNSLRKINKFIVLEFSDKFCFVPTFQKCFCSKKIRNTPTLQSGLRSLAHGAVDIYIYIYIYVCVSVCVDVDRGPA